MRRQYEGPRRRRSHGQIEQLLLAARARNVERRFAAQGRPPDPPERVLCLLRCPGGLALEVGPPRAMVGRPEQGGRLLTISGIPAVYSDREAWEVTRAVEAAGALPEPIDGQLAFEEIAQAGIRAGVLEEG